MGLDVSSHLHPVASFDLADHPVPNGREEVWRFTPLKRLRGLHAEAVLTGTDGRRGYLQHLAVAPSHRRRGVGRALAEQAVEALRVLGIAKCHLMVREENAQARAFWERLGWKVRADVTLMSHAGPDAANA